MPRLDDEYRLRVGSDLLRAFLKVCDAMDRTGAQVVRDAMRQYVREHSDALQSDIRDALPQDA